MNLYPLIRPIIFLLPPETAHRWTIKYLKVVQWLIEHENPQTNLSPDTQRAYGPGKERLEDDLATSGCSVNSSLEGVPSGGHEPRAGVATNPEPNGPPS